MTGSSLALRAQPEKSNRFARENYFPLGWQTCVAQFVSLFHRYGYIYKPLSGGSWFSANEKWKLPDSEILKAIACVHPKFFLGCRAGKSSRFAVLDIDQKSQYHNKRAIDKLLQVLSDAGLSRSSLYRSSYSGGWHLYLFFEEAVNSADLRKQIIKLLTLHDLQIAKGQLEVFPHPGSDESLGLGLRLPLQPGFAWLDKKTLEVEHERSELNATKAMELFIDALDGDANSYAAFRQLKTHVQDLEQRKAAAEFQGRGEASGNVVPLRKTKEPSAQSEFTDVVRAVFQKLPPGIIVDNWYKGRLYHLNGLTGPSQRAESIECLGHYLFYGDPSRDLPALGYGYEQEREWAIREFLNIRHNGQSEEINRGRGDALAQVERAANWRPPSKQSNEPNKYRSQRPISWVRENANRKSNARERISDALASVKKLQRAFTTVELQEAAGCSRETLYKHADIWRKDYDDLADGFFAICTDEYNGVEGAGSPETMPPSPPSFQEMPLGRLAARRIAYEISMRDARERRRVRKAAVSSEEALEENWRAKVTALTETEPAHQSMQQLKTVLVVLVGYLGNAPNYECQQFIQVKIAALRAILKVRSEEAEAKPSFARGP